MSEAAASDDIAHSRDCIDCDFCGTASPPKCCAQCHSNYYCNRDCQKSHWKTHKSKCKGLSESLNHWKAANSSTDGKTTDTVDGPCAICLEDTVTNPVSLDCGHVFCFACLGEYQTTLSGPGSCPHCRGDVPYVPNQCFDRAENYFRRALNKAVGSPERKTYAELSAAEYDALLKIRIFGDKNLLGLFMRAKMLSYARKPEDMITIASELLLVNEKGKNGKLDNNEILEAKTWIADATLAM
mmetsp:Transcript_10250/g.22793  ORF Transcript_10250/g.22793 Transcript_10250/m.22793 type:complete len:241 (+) Transcript_10250:650-1372(+)